MKQYSAKIPLMLVGVLLMGVSVRLLVYADMGTDPFTTACLALSARLGCLLGTAELFANGILFAVVLLFGRAQIGPGTLANMVLVGYVADFTGWLLRAAGLYPPQRMAGRLVLMAAALALFVFAASLYMNAQLGTAPYDAMAFILAKRAPALPFRLVRIGWDALWIILTLLAGGRVGPVALLIALTMGPAVEHVGRWLNQRIGGTAV